MRVRHETHLEKLGTEEARLPVGGVHGGVAMVGIDHERREAQTFVEQRQLTRKVGLVEVLLVALHASRLENE